MILKVGGEGKEGNGVRWCGEGNSVWGKKGEGERGRESLLRLLV